MADDLLVASGLTRIRDILAQARRQALQAVNAAMVAAYWHIGREIVEEEQRGQDRAGYGDRLVRELSARLTAEFGKGFSFSHLKLVRQFYLAYRERSPEIGCTVCSLFDSAAVDAPTAPSQHPTPAVGNPLRAELSWSHYG
jgi:hypothetical protein